MTAISINRFECEVVANYRAKGRAPKTISQIEQVLDELREVGVSRTNHVTTAAIERWITAWPDRTPVTFRSHLRCLSGLCTRLAKAGPYPH